MGNRSRGVADPDPVSFRFVLGRRLSYGSGYESEKERKNQKDFRSHAGHLPENRLMQGETITGAPGGSNAAERPGEDSELVWPRRDPEFGNAAVGSIAALRRDVGSGAISAGRFLARCRRDASAWIRGCFDAPI